MKDKISFSELNDIQVSDEDDWFDPRLDKDTNLCIDPFLVFNSGDERFSECRDRFMRFFETAFKLASRIDEIPSKNDLKASNRHVDYKYLINHVIAFSEPEEICLGFSKKGTGGSGPGSKFAQSVADSLISMSRERSSLPKHFEAIAIFTPGIGSDGISDTTAHLIKKELIEYTVNICKKYKVPTQYFCVKNAEFVFENEEWDDKCFHLPLNPFNRKPILLVPKKFLRQLPSISPEELYRYVESKPNQEIRDRLNYKVNNELRKCEIENEGEGSQYQKSKVVEYVKNNPCELERFISHVESNQSSYVPYDLVKDSENLYTFPRTISKFVYSNPLPNVSCGNEEEFQNLLNALVQQLKLFVEEKNGYKLLWNEGDKDFQDSGQQSPVFRKEVDAQALFKMLVGDYCAKSGIKLKEESSLGTRNPVVFEPKSKAYKGKALFLVKLFRNVKLGKDDLVALASELRRSHTRYCYYVIFVHDERNLKELKEILEEVKKNDFKNIDFNPILINVMLNRENKSLLFSEYSTSNKEVCISYASGGVSGQIADDICKILRDNNVKVVRDSEDLRYKDSLTGFMQRIGQGRCVVTLISEKYLKSKYCMSEFFKLVNAGGMKERIVPVVLDDAGIYDSVTKVKYVEYWEGRLKEVKKALEDIDPENSRGATEDMHLYSDVSRYIGRYIEELQDFIVKPVKIQSDSEFKDVVSEVKKILAS
jgi:hypothetical protein